MQPQYFFTLYQEAEMKIKTEFPETCLDLYIKFFINYLCVCVCVNALQHVYTVSGKK